MKGKLCGLLLVSVITFGLSLSVSSDTNALKYAYNAFNFNDRVYFDNGSFSNEQRSRFTVQLYDKPSDSSIDSDLLSTNSSYTTLEPCSDNNTKFRLFETQNDSSSLLRFYSGNLLNTLVVGSYQNPTNNMYVPSCNYSYDSIYSTSYNLSTGDSANLVDLREVLFDSGDSSYNSGKISWLDIPLSLNENFDYIPAGTPLDFDFSLVTNSANSFPTLNTINARLYYSYFTSLPTTNFSSNFRSHTYGSSSPQYVAPISCSVDYDFRLTTVTTDETEDFRGFNVHCSLTPSSDMYYFHPFLQLDTSFSYFVEYDYHGIYFGGSFLTTNNDSTWSGQYANSIPTGDNLQDAPGYHQLYGYDSTNSCVEGDWFCHLTELFNFNFINPFQPIFSMFSPATNCASIPIISGMIHSEETTVCPFFSSETRSILTPVFTLSSMMIIFGFAVRWLGARSGNMVEDDFSGDAGGFNVGTKRRTK